MVRVATIWLVLLVPAAAAAQACTDAAIHCNGRWVSIPCGATDAEIQAACSGGSSVVSSGGGESAPVLVQLAGGAVEAFKDANRAQLAAWSREVSDRTAEVGRNRPSVPCVLLLDDLAESTETFAKEGEDFANGFAKEELESTLDKLRDQHKTKAKHEKAYEAFKAWSEKVRKWSTDLREWETCLRTPGCSVLDLAWKDRKALKKWLAEKWGGEDSVDRVDRAADFLESYTQRIAEKNLAYAQKAAECSGK